MNEYREGQRGKTKEVKMEQTNGQLGPRKMKVHSLTGELNLKRLKLAFENVKGNKGSAGMDRVTINQFEQNLWKHLEHMQEEMTSGTFRPVPLRRVYIPKANGKTRPLGIPTIRDRTAQEAIRNILEPVFEPLFHDNSFGFRPNRGCHDALERIKQYHKEGFKYVVDADITGCFDNIPHKIIMQTLSWVIADGNILTTVERFLEAGIMENGIKIPTVKGTPQGGPISPLLANIVLNRMDWQLAHNGYRFVRYADDFVILCRTQHDAEKAYAYVSEILGEIGLELSKEKTKITSFREGFDFLGFHLSQNDLIMKTKAVERFKSKVKELTIRKHNLDKTVILQLNSIIRGTANYFGIHFASTKKQFRNLDKFVRRRVRCMKMKRIWDTDNYRIPIEMIKKWGLVSLTQTAPSARSPPCSQTIRATKWGPPGAGKTHAGKYGELTPLR